MTKKFKVIADILVQATYIVDSDTDITAKQQVLLADVKPQSTVDVTSPIIVYVEEVTE